MIYKYFNEIRLWNYFDLNQNNKDNILDNNEYNDKYSDEYNDECRFGAHSDEQIILLDILRTIVIIHGDYYQNK